MNRDDIHRMAREASGGTTWWPLHTDTLERFFHMAYAAGVAANREWQELTDEDIAQACGFGEHTTTALQHMLIAIARAVEAKSKEKNT